MIFLYLQGYLFFTRIAYWNSILKIKYYSNIKSCSSFYILQGMQYVHTSVFRSHGRLKSSNCVIDNRWLCKVTDFGLIQLKEEDTPKSKTSDEFQKYNGKLPIC